MKTAFITGILGQDGSYLAEHLYNLGYTVWGMTRRSAQTCKWFSVLKDKVNFVYGDMRDAASIECALWKIRPDEIYNFAAQVFVPVSWPHPAETFDVNVGGLGRLMDAVERVCPKAHVYQASSSEMFGNLDEAANESTPFAPVSPYGASKLAAHNLVGVYRKRGLYVTSGIVFNHESPRRGSEMVTQKIAMHVARWAKGDTTPLELGNMDALRDWGFAGDYVKAMHAMLQQEQPSDYVIGTGEMHSVRDFYEAAKSAAGINGDSRFELRVNQSLVRVHEIRRLRANPSRARMELGWVPETSFEKLVEAMVQSELQ